jgi:voltage-gated potassium channel Kch
LLEAAGAKEAKIIVIAIDDPDKATELVRIVRHNFPNLKILARVYDRAHAYDVLREGVDNVYREVFGTSMDVAEDALVALGHHPHEASRAVKLFRRHDEKFLRKSAEHAGDQRKLIDLARVSRAEIANVFSADRGERRQAGDTAWHDVDSGTHVAPDNTGAVQSKQKVK